MKIINLSCSSKICLFQEALATVEDLVATRALRGEKPVQKRWFQHNTANPEGYYTDNTGHTLRDENGEITGAFVVFS